MSKVMARRWLLLALVFAVGMLRDGTALGKPLPTIAVMPFRDLTGKGKPHIGEAIREVVASDLKSLSGVRIVERGSLDKILKEMRVQASLKEVEDDTAAKLGKVVGASVMVIGAFQEESGQIRLTARFVRVETSEVMGSAKVDGNIKQFFRLQDRVTAELLRSSGLPQLAKQVADGSDSRPELKSMDALDVYGRAVTAETDEQKVVLLRSAVAIDQNFSYAVKDLAELEARLTKYQAEQKRLVDAQIEALRKELGSTTDRQRIDVSTNQLLLLLERSRRLNTLRKEARLYLDGLPAGPVSGRYFEDASRMLIMASVHLRDWDAVLRDGEAFMQRAPGSSIFETIRLMVVQGIEQKRLVAEGKQKVAQRLKEYPNLLGWDLCQLAGIYGVFQQNLEARRLYEACLRTSEKPTVQTLQSLVSADMMLGDFEAMRRHLSEAEKLDPTVGRSLRTTYSSTLPAD